LQSQIFLLNASLYLEKKKKKRSLFSTPPFFYYYFFFFLLKRTTSTTHTIISFHSPGSIGHRTAECRFHGVAEPLINSEGAKIFSG
jgi:hypothetical protein